jgi:hypothetical protein
MAALAEVDGLLRSTGRFSVRRAGVPWGHLVLFLVAGGFLYGAAMGTFNLRPLQALYSGSKVPLLLVVSTVVCLPSFFVLNTVLGLRNDFVAAMRGVIAAQATMAVALVGLAPLTLFVYGSSSSYDLALNFNGLVFLVAALAGQATLSRHYRPLIARDPRHKLGRALWLGLYIFVAIQMAWVLRPFVGSPGLKTQFFREEAWSNAYVVVLGKVLSFFGGGS